MVALVFISVFLRWPVCGGDLGKSPIKGEMRRINIKGNIGANRHNQILGWRGSFYSWSCYVMFVELISLLIIVATACAFCFIFILTQFKCWRDLLAQSFRRKKRNRTAVAHSVSRSPPDFEKTRATCRIVFLSLEAKAAGSGLGCRLNHKPELGKKLRLLADLAKWLVLGALCPP